MTNQEARGILANLYSSILTDGDPACKREVEALRMAIETLEKQIPKKPIRIDKNKEFDGNWKKLCPLCGRVLMERITTSESSYPRHYNYTGHCWCGQAIDWGNE